MGVVIGVERVLAAGLVCLERSVGIRVLLVALWVLGDIDSACTKYNL